MYLDIITAEMRAPLKNKYKLAKEEYFKIIQDAHEERVYQEFFEKYPFFLPGDMFSSNIIHSAYNRQPYPAAVISQPVLQSYKKRIPDFLWITYDNDNIYPIFIEIEKPSKKFFDSKNVPTKNLTQAIDQLDEWSLWFSDNSNQQIFWKSFNIPYFLHQKQVQPQYILIYGLRTEFEYQDLLRLKLSRTMKDKGYHLFCYDDLNPSIDDFFRPGQYKTIKFSTEGIKFIDDSNYNYIYFPIHFLLNKESAPFLSEEERNFYLTEYGMYQGDKISLLPENVWDELRKSKIIK